ncbi:MAG TPA: glucose-6-phosphate dehydrogenase [Coriobacteriia bacterium]|nr:glucose-6-phosphate dehydrogenase [Coriobacteriia bacterium]
MSDRSEHLSPTILVVFGTTGDLFSRKIVPSLFYLRGLGLLPQRLCVVGFGRREWDDERLRLHVRQILAEHTTDAEPSDVEDFVHLFRYQRGEFNDPESYAATQVTVDSIQHEWGVCSNKLFYLAVPPEHYSTIFRSLAGSRLTEPCSNLEGWTRVLVEKPFGDDLDTARELDTLLGSLFREEQIYRIDHYLAKEMLQGIINFRFTNNLFESEWGRQAIERIDITLLEEIGAEKRGAFYDAVGALRDVGQNHLLQMLALVTMDQPDTMSPAAIRASRAELIESLRPMQPGEVARSTFRAQYAGFREIAGVSTSSDTETYFKVRTTLTGQRWAGVPVTMESGKRMGEACKRIVVTFKHPHPCLCEARRHHTNKVVFTLEPNDRIEIVFYAKKPGFDADVEERIFSFFLYEKQEKTQYVEEYAKLLYDAVRGDQTLFVSTREVDAGWRFIDPVVQGWEAGLVPLEHYEADTDDIVDRADAALAEKARGGEVGICGLGKMGAGLARNLVDGGWRVVGWNRTHAVAKGMESEGLIATETLHELVEKLVPPRVIWLMVPAGRPVDDLLFGAPAESVPGADVGLASLLMPGDTVIDGGNSHYSEATGRAERLAAAGIHFVDCGTSGGPDGARSGACLMIGGTRSTLEPLEPMFADVAAPGAYRFFDGHGAGHFVKMVHNGIEYGMMQAIAEGFEVLHSSAFDLDLEQVADLYQHRSVVQSRLVGWLAEQYAELGDDLEGVSGVVGYSGEGEWTIAAAKELGVPVPVIEDSLAARVDSAENPRYAGKVLTAMRDAFGGHGLGPGGVPRR